MNATEIKAWTLETMKSEHAWRTDAVLRENQGIWLIFKGGVDGQYIEIQPDGKATCGNYSGAMPCITDAAFEPVYTKQFDDLNQALTVITTKMGVHFLMTAITDCDRR
jgi:hypothetical protein